MDERAKFGIVRVARGESVNDVVDALLQESRLGDPNELERLYGHEFNSSGQLASFDDLEVPTLFRKILRHHGYTFSGSQDDTHHYDRHDGHKITIHAPSDSTNLHWAHLDTHHKLAAQGNTGQSLLDHLDHIHS